MVNRIDFQWDGDRLKIGNRLSGYSIVPDESYPMMWRVRKPDGTLTDMANRARAKEAAALMLQSHSTE